tara:strand:+ start:851 stop:1009 length:159 start_codon:yes stop_codon:yes gene_type:complete
MTKILKPTLRSTIALYKKRGLSNPELLAQNYMRGFDDAMKYSIKTKKKKQKK